MRHTLDFEKTISDLQDKIEKLKDSGSDKTSLVEVNEQIEEEQRFEGILQKFNLLGRDKLAIYEVDKLLSDMATAASTTPN